VPFFQVVRRRDLPGFLLSERIYPAGLRIPPHHHEHAYISLVMEGEYAEILAEETVRCYPGAFRYMPPLVEHANEFAQTTCCLLVRIEATVLARFESRSTLPQHPGEIQGIAAAWLGKRIYQEFQAEDESSSLALQGILLELLAEGARTIEARRNGENRENGLAPRWLRRVHDFLETSFRENLSLNEIAGVGDVHPVHLAREYRRYFGCSIGEFLRRKRIEQACQLLARSNAPISEIALACGFSDQSHFSSAFKRQAGVTPGKFRQLA